MHDKYFNDAIVGNDIIRASFTKTGELMRLFYGSADYKQFLDRFNVGLKINDSAIVYLHNDINNVYSQEYIEHTNIIETQIYNKYFNVKISQTDFVPIGENFLVKDYVIKNENTIDLNINFLVYSKILTNLNNDTSGFIRSNSLLQYNHDFTICTFSKQEIYKYQVNGASNNFMTGIIGGKDYIGMSQDSAICYNLEKIEPGQEKRITLYIYINKNKEKDLIKELDSEIERIKNLDVKNIKEDTIEYWKIYLKEHDIEKIDNKEIDSKIKKIYDRTILLYPLLINKDTGGISAGIEVDEDKTKCGRYSYCWPRDAVFITEAFNIIGMEADSEKFYSKFCNMTQNQNGMWEQRFYTDGRLAPCWGYQIDETASVIFGAYAHYKFCKNKIFLKENLDMLEKAVAVLEKYIDNLLENGNYFKLSYDLWEEFEGFSFYSISSIFAAFSAMIKIYNLIKEDYELENQNIYDDKIENLQKKTLQIKEYCENNFYDNEKKTYVRNTKDKKIDISLIGAIVPFKMFLPNEKKVENTIEKINLTLRTYTGGYVRYENDNYMGGYNPWPIATLWMAWYYLEVGNNEKAIECFNFVTNSSTSHGFLGEQINNEDMKPCWVIGLTWSHAMYIITLKKLLEKGCL